MQNTIFCFDSTIMNELISPNVIFNNQTERITVIEIY